MSEKLVLSYENLEAIINNEIWGFTVIYNDIPQEGEPSDYIEDDNRQHRFCSFKDNETGHVYEFSYTWTPDTPSMFLKDMFKGVLPHSIEIVPKNQYVAPSKSEDYIEQEVEQDSPEKAHDKKLWQRYNESEQVSFELKKEQVPISVVDDVVSFIKKKSYNIYQLRAKILPVCIEYGIEQKSFWNDIQKRASK